ncbi:uncharacterized protein [Capricornis sumatraensis]|uniref:uncharacterized protein n=1 Tax=Capricornis sumatraensis TaxID=34865 RepID=UPI0036051612
MSTGEADVQKGPTRAQAGMGPGKGGLGVACQRGLERKRRQRTVSQSPTAKWGMGSGELVRMAPYPLQDGSAFLSNWDPQHPGPPAPRNSASRTPSTQELRIQDPQHPGPPASRTPSTQDPQHSGPPASRTPRTQDPPHPGPPAPRTPSTEEPPHPGPPASRNCASRTPRIQDPQHPGPPAPRTPRIQDPQLPGPPAPRTPSTQDPQHPGPPASRTPSTQELRIQDPPHPGPPAPRTPSPVGSRASSAAAWRAGPGDSARPRVTVGATAALAPASGASSPGIRVGTVQHGGGAQLAL